MFFCVISWLRSVGEGETEDSFVIVEGLDARVALTYLWATDPGERRAR